MAEPFDATATGVMLTAGQRATWGDLVEELARVRADNARLRRELQTAEIQCRAAEARATVDRRLAIVGARPAQKA